MFKYNPLISISDKTIDSASDTLTTIYKISPQQFQPYELTNTSYNTENSSNGIKIAEFTGKLYVRSLGTNGAEASYFSVMNKSIHMDAGGNSGMNLLKVRKTDGKILQYKNFKMTFPTSSDSILNFLNTFDTTHYLMGLNAAYVAGTFLLNTNVINKFAQFGSTKVSNFRIGFFDSWSFIGYLGAPQSDVSETLNRYISSWIESESSQIKNSNGHMDILNSALVRLMHGKIFHGIIFFFLQTKFYLMSME
ncbi:MAG: hypothetical protein IPM38_19210 [Ignavibacteria bacterium]|nr:hypothetical protein [Ignavibacteria bacterium]